MKSEITQATEAVRKYIKDLYPGAFKGKLDDAGEEIYVHLDDGHYAATVNYRRAFLDERDGLVEDQINELLEERDLPFYAERLSSYEIALYAQ